MDAAEATALLRAHVDPALEVRRRHARHRRQQPGDVVRRGPHGDAARRRELVVRRTAPAGVLAWTDREQEYAVLRALAGTRAARARRCSRSAATSARSSSWSGCRAARPAGSRPRSARRSGASSAPCSRACTRSTRASSASRRAAPPPLRRSRRCATTSALYRSARPGPVPLLGGAPRLGGAERPGRRDAAGRALGRPGRAQPARRRRPHHCPPRLGADARRRPARRPRGGRLELPRLARPRRRRRGLRGGGRARSTGGGSPTSSRSRARPAR